MGLGDRRRPPRDVNAPTRSPDSFLHAARVFVVRRIAADTRKVERDSNFDCKLDAKPLRAMGSEIGSIHASTSRLAEAILGDLKHRDSDWLYGAAKAAASVVEADFAEWGESVAGTKFEEEGLIFLSTILSIFLSTRLRCITIVTHVRSISRFWYRAVGFRAVINQIHRRVR
jgi:hypothetical protein